MKIQLEQKSDFDYFRKKFPLLNGANDLVKFQEKVSTNFYNFITQIYSRSNPDQFLSYSETKKKFKKIHSDLSKKIKNNNKEYYEFIGKYLGKDKSIFSLTQNDFEGIQLLASEISSEVKNYSILQSENDHKEIRATKWGENIQYLNKEEFVAKYGRPPLEILNETLNRYDCNGYHFQSNNYYPSPSEDSSKTIVPLSLVNKEKGITTSLDNISSGEQTLLAISLIIYKMRRNNILPRVLLLDEVDSALHPSMIQRLLEVIKEIFIIEKGLKVILTTHSPSTVALYSADKVYIVENNEKLQIIPESRKAAIEILSEGFATLDGGLMLLDQTLEREISIISEGLNTLYLDKANSYFGSDNIKIIDKFEHRSGKNQIKTLFEFFKLMKHKNKVIFVWDCDVNSKLESSNNTFPFIFKKNLENNKVTTGIENLFSDKLFKDEFYEIRQKSDGGHHRSLNKRKFADYILNNGSEKDFANFKPLFDWIKLQVNKQSN